ncbi:hypothetical protein GF314_08310 [bacterium]|nr:hypothetical protein [bacterium]
MPRPLLAFLHLAKTGGRTFDTVLRSTYGPGYVQAEALRPHRPIGLDDGEFVAPVYGPDDLRRVRRHCPWLRAIGGHTLTLWSDLHETAPVRYVAFLREPLARGASHYQFHVATTDEPLDWDRWCAWPEHHDHQVRYFDRGGDPDRAIAAIEEHQVFIGLLERFDESLLLLQRLAAPELRPAYRRRNIAGSNALARELLDDPARRDQLHRMYAREFPLHEWVTRTLWPRYEQAYGPTLAEDAARLRADPDRGFRAWPDRIARAQHRFWVEPWVARQRRRHATV